MFEDYGNNVLADEKLIEAVEIINEAKQYAGKTKIENAKKKDDREFNEISTIFYSRTIGS